MVRLPSLTEAGNGASRLRSKSLRLQSKSLQDGHLPEQQNAGEGCAGPQKVARRQSKNLRLQSTASVESGPPPKLHEAIAALTHDDISSLRGARQPSEAVRRLCEAMYLVSLPLSGIQVPPQNFEWKDVRALLISQNLHETIINYDVDKLCSAPEIRAHIKAEYLAKDSPGQRLTSTRMRRASVSCGLVFDWISALMDEAGDRMGSKSVASKQSLIDEGGSRRGSKRVASKQSPTKAAELPLAEALVGRVVVAGEATPRIAVEPSLPISAVPKDSVTQPCPPDVARMPTPSRIPSMGPRLWSGRQRSASHPVVGTPRNNRGNRPRVVVLVGTARATLRIIAQRLLNSNPDTVLVCALHGKDACKALRTTLAEEAAFLLDRLEIELIDSDSFLLARVCAERVAARHGTIDGLVIDAKAFRKLPGAATMFLRRCDAVLGAFRPHFEVGARVVAVGAPCGQVPLPRTQRALLLRQTLEELLSAGLAFSTELAAAKGVGRQPPCFSPSGWWLDTEEFPMLLMNALVCAWHQQYSSDLCVCVCGCVPGVRPDADEALTVTMLLDEARKPSSIAGRRFTNFAAPAPWPPAAQSSKDFCTDRKLLEPAEEVLKWRSFGG